MTVLDTRGLGRSWLWTMALALAGFGVAMLSGCASSSPPAGSADFVLVYLKTGPKSAEKTAEERKTVFEGHMANIHRLGDEGKLVIAGPFGAARDNAWRGIFVMDTPRVEQAREWGETDPGVKAGVFSLEYRPMRASVGLRKTMEYEKELLAQKGANMPASGSPPPNVRAYVMVTASDEGRAMREIDRAGLSEKVVWCGKFTDFAKGAVFVLDAKDVKEVEAALGGPLSVAGAMMGLDGWWSTVSLERLSTEAPHRP